MLLKVIFAACAVSAVLGSVHQEDHEVVHGLQAVEAPVHGHVREHGHEHGDHADHDCHQSYKFGYKILDKYGNKQAREEEADEYNNRKGYYSFLDHNGRHRKVEYVADKHGFRATVLTNEPGTDRQDPADVKMLAKPAEVVHNAGHHLHHEEDSKHEVSHHHEVSQEVGHQEAVHQEAVHHDDGHQEAVHHGDDHREVSNHLPAYAATEDYRQGAVDPRSPSAGHYAGHERVQLVQKSSVAVPVTHVAKEAYPVTVNSVRTAHAEAVYAPVTRFVPAVHDHSYGHRQVVAGGSTGYAPVAVRAGYGYPGQVAGHSHFVHSGYELSSGHGLAQQASYALPMTFVLPYSQRKSLVTGGYRNARW